MLDRKLHKFYLTCKLNGNIETYWVEGINLRHAKEKLQMNCPEATDLMDWTYEKPEALEKFRKKFNDSKQQEIAKQYKEYPEDFGIYF